MQTLQFFNGLSLKANQIRTGSTCRSHLLNLERKALGALLDGNISAVRAGECPVRRCKSGGDWRFTGLPSFYDKGGGGHACMVSTIIEESSLFWYIITLRRRHGLSDSNKYLQSTGLPLDDPQTLDMMHA